MRGTYRACGKAILIGEHFVVHGTPAVALPVQAIGTRVDVHSEPTDAPPRLVTAHAEGQRLLERALELLGRDGGGLRVEVASTIPVGYGLGSSAAVSVALIGALSDLEGEELNAAAHELERLIHGNPSGIDDTVITWGRPLLFRRGWPHTPLAAPARPLRFVRASSGRPGSTRDAVAGVADFGRRNPGRFDAILSEAHGAVDRALRALGAADVAALGAEMDHAHALLSEVGVSTPRLDELVSVARAAGAAGAKLTGGGLGGFMIAVGEAPEALAAALAEAGAAPVLVTEVS